MKKNAVLRIVIYSVLALLLTAVLVLGITNAIRFPGEIGVQIGSSEWDGTEATQGAVPADSIEEMKIEWASGTVTIECCNTSEIQFSQSTDKVPLAWSEEAGELKIRFQKEPFSPGFNSGKMRKDLTVTVPVNWYGGIELDAASTELKINGLKLQDLDIDGASNDVTVIDSNIHEISLDGASNQLHYEGTLDQLDSDGASNDCTLILENKPSEFEMDGVSSKLELTVPEDFGFIIDSDGLSFDLDTDFDVFRHDKDLYVSGDGNCQISIDGISCKVAVHKAALNR